MFSDPLFALSPLDGRYARAVDPLREYMSEYSLFRDRVGVEIAYLRALSQNTSIVRNFTEKEDQFLLTILELFATNDAKRVQELEMERVHFMHTSMRLAIDHNAVGFINFKKFCILRRREFRKSL